MNEPIFLFHPLALRGAASVDMRDTYSCCRLAIYKIPAGNGGVRLVSARWVGREGYLWALIDREERHKPLKVVKGREVIIVTPPPRSTQNPTCLCVSFVALAFDPG